ncbi:putative Exporters of the RND superfamily [uncultured Desulfobacterium sp.]|uniref:Putative Exporters of the RND superfamily n=1 Tax=uncultured Desulfobacterium sp. TaxID=201089 RepID=A0A445N0B2_9BACT|nr:putative Exporters of the RND superfamily [uncultured Desulfobacterium sp.]
MIKKICTFSIRHKWVVATVILLITAFFVFQLKNMVIRSQVSDLYPTTHPFIKVHNAYKDQLGSPFKIVMMLKVKEGDIYNKDTLAKAIKINEAIDAIPGVNHNYLYSIASYKLKRIKFTESGVETYPLMPEVPKSMEEFKETIRTARGVFGVWVSRDEKCILFTAGFNEQMMEYDVIFERVNRIIKEVSDSNNEVFAAGDPVLMGWVNKFQREAYTIFIVTFIAFLTLLWLYFRNIIGVLAPIPSIFLGAIWFLGLAGTLGYNVEPLTMVIPLLIVARSLSHAVQFTERYFEIYHEQGEKDVDGALIETMTHIFPPGILGIVTDALGIILIAVAPVPMMQKLAYLCGFWAFSNIITGLFFTPIFISLFSSWHPKNIGDIVDMKKGITQKILGQIARLGYGRPSYVTFVVAVGVLLFTGYYAMKVDIGDIHPGSSLLWPDSEFNISVENINSHFPGTEELYVIVKGEGRRPVENPGFLRILNSFQSYMEQSPDVGRTLCVADMLPQMYSLIYNGHPKWETFPQTKTEGYQLYSKLEASSAPGDYDMLYARDGSFANVIVWYKNHMGETLRNAVITVNKFIEDKKDVLAAEKCSILLASGNIGVLAAINEVVQGSQMLNFILVMGSVLFLCALTYRSVVAAIILMIPLNLTNIITMAIMRWLDIGLNMNTLPVVSVGVGVGIDYGIYLMSRICEEYQTAGHQYSSEVVTRAIKTTGKAIFFTGTTMIVGVIFFYFLSSLKFQAEMGLLLALIMFINIFAALVLIPVLISVFKPRFLGNVKFVEGGSSVGQPAAA